MGLVFAAALISLTKLGQGPFSSSSSNFVFRFLFSATIFTSCSSQFCSLSSSRRHAASFSEPRLRSSRRAMRPFGTQSGQTWSKARRETN